MILRVKLGRLSASTAMGVGHIARNALNPASQGTPRNIQRKICWMQLKKMGYILVCDEAVRIMISDVLSEVHDHDHYQDAVCDHHEEHEMHDDVQPNHVVDSHADYTTVISNMTSLMSICKGQRL
ncbi:hypothetical protein Tco_0733761 [Tanacetum coccineum]